MTFSSKALWSRMRHALPWGSHATIFSNSGFERIKCNFTGNVGDPPLSLEEKMSLFFDGWSAELSKKLVDEALDSALCSCLLLELLSVPLSVACLSSLSGSPSLGKLSDGELSLSA